MPLQRFIGVRQSQSSRQIMVELRQLHCKRLRSLQLAWRRNNKKLQRQTDCSKRCQVDFTDNNDVMKIRARLRIL